MKTAIVKCTGLLESVELYEGDSLEEKVEKILENKEPITDGAPLIFTERKNGVMAGFNIRTDRFDIAIEGMDKVNMAKQAMRETKAKEMEAVPDKIEGGTPSDN